VFDIISITPQALFGQLLVGLINGSFYAILSLGLAVIFGLLNVVNFTHGAQYMMGAFATWMLLNYVDLGYWWAFVLAPIIVGATGVVIERLLISKLYKLDHLYGLLVTFGLALIIQGIFRNYYGSSGMPYSPPEQLQGGTNLGFMILPTYRASVVVASVTVCLTTWFVIEKTKLGSYLRAATENATLTQAFGINVPQLVTITYGFGVGLAAFAGVLAAPIYSVSPDMGADIIIVVFAVVVFGGMGSILGSIVAGFGLGLIESLTKVFYAEASATVIFVAMVIVLLIKPAGLFGRAAVMASYQAVFAARPVALGGDTAASTHKMIFTALAAALLAAPIAIYPVFLMKVMCFALFACAFNLLLGFGGLMSFGHAAFFGMASYISAYSAKSWGFTPELAILSGTLSATILGAAFGYLAVRRQGIYFAMITLALAQMVFFICVQAPFTGGEDGIQAVHRGKLFGMISLADDMVLYYVVVAIFMGGLLLIYRIIHSPFGQVCKAIRDNEPRSISLGYRASHYKLAVFVLSSAIAGLAGATKAIFFQFASLTDVHWSMSGEPVLMTLIGGIGTVFGPVVGAAVVVTMEDYLASLGTWVTVIQGVIFVLCVMLFREGIVGVIARRLKRPL
jgi:branched-chain amino acid transport system permease protein